MFDPEFEKFYQCVRDPSWPDVTGFGDFLSIDPLIINECFEKHNLQKKINEITDINYWSPQTDSVCVSGNLAFVPLQKCAYKYYTTKLTEQGWQKTQIQNIDMSSTHFFGFMMHPLKRYLKGLAQILVCSFARTTTITADNPWNSVNDIDWDSLDKSLDSPYLHNLMNRILVGDEHAMPYYFMFGDLVHKVHWIPMDILSDNEMKLHAMAFCEQHGQGLSLKLDDQRIHESPPLQLKAYEIIKNIFYNPSDIHPNRIYQFYKIFGPDLKFYYHLLVNFKNQPL